MIRLLSILTILATGSAQAETLVATRTLRAHSILTAQDIAISSNASFRGLTDPADAVGMEARVVLYAGRPIRASDVGPPAIVERNQVVPLIFQISTLKIATDGRALARGAEGDLIRIMNIASRTTVTGRIARDGTVHVAQ